MIEVVAASPGTHPYRVEMVGPGDATDDDFSRRAQEIYQVRYDATVIDREGVARASAVRVPPRRRGAIRVVRLQARHVEPGDAVRIGGSWVEVLSTENGTAPVGREAGHPPVTITYLDCHDVQTAVLCAVDMLAVQDIA